MHVVICDVGQGDAIFIRTPKGSDILVDGGRDDLVLNCLADHMPFWDRDLELVILTHPHSDHFVGFFSVFKNYKIATFATEDLKNNTQNFQNLMELVKKQAIPVRFIIAGDRFKLKDGVILDIVGPTREFLETTSPGGTIGESSEFASLLTLVKYKTFSTLLTGDSQALELQDAIDKGYLSKISVLQVPHHGSKTGLTEKILDVLRPNLAVISVGKNSYGHPAPEILKVLSEKNSKILRTDWDGEIEIMSDGEKWIVR